MSLKAPLMHQIKLDSKIKINSSIILEKLSDKHTKSLLEYANDSFFFQYMEYKKKNKRSQKKYINEKIKINNFKQFFFYSIIFEKTIVGTFFISKVSFFANNIDISYGINPEYWGKNIFSSILKSLLIYFKKKKVNRIQAITRHDNLPSIRGLKKNGFNLEGKLTKYYFDLKTNSYHDAYIFSKLF